MHVIGAVLVRGTKLLLLMGLLVASLLGCAVVDRATITREGSFPLDEALTIHKATFRPVYEFVAAFYAERGGVDTKFETKGKIVQFLAVTMPPHVAESIAGAFIDDRGYKLFDVFFPTIFHEDIVVARAYLERVRFRYGPDTLFLVIEETHADEAVNRDLQFHRATRYVERPSGEWVLYNISGTHFYRGASYSPLGPR